MSEPPRLTSVDEFDWIARLRPLTRGEPAARDLMDDAAVIAPRDGQELVVTTDAMVEGVHFLAGEAPDVVARRLLRTNLSDLAAKAAEPYGYFLTTAFPSAYGPDQREAFARGLAEDGERYGLALLGGDTSQTDGPLVVSAALLGWVPVGKAIARSGATAGDALVVCGTIGDGWLGLRAARGEIADPDGSLAARYRLPEPLLALREPLRACADAAADVSDGLLADAGRIAEASGLGFEIHLERLPLSAAAEAWLAGQPDDTAARLALAAGGDDYALVCAVGRFEEGFVAAVTALGLPVRQVGVFREAGMAVLHHGAKVKVGHLGWRHGGSASSP